MIRRGLRLEIVAGLGIALTMPVLAMAAESSQALATQTTLSTETRDQGGRTLATFTVTVSGEDGLPATGAVSIKDHGRPLAGAALNSQGQAKIQLDLPAGEHLLRAVYSGDTTHRGSVSLANPAQGQTGTGTPDFQVSVTPATLSLTAGQSGTVTASITPVNASALTAPMFVTLSCSGLPDQSSCTFTPESIEILQNGSSAIPSSMVVQTEAASTASTAPARQRDSNPIAWAFLLPGALGLVGLAWGSRRCTWLSRLSMVALVGLVTVLGATACNPRYDYLNHGPPQNPATPAGNYTVSVTAQSSNGIAATTHTITMALTVK